MRVEAAIAETGYRRNGVARSLAAGRTHTVGLAISALTNPYFGSLVHAVEQALSDAGYVLIVGDSHDAVESEKRVTDSLLDRQVDGMIVAPAAGSENVHASRDHAHRNATRADRPDARRRLATRWARRTSRRHRC